jgi:hypothetical protein
MAVTTTGSGPSGGALTEVLELILDRGVVIDIFVRVSLVGIEILTIDARVVVASVDTYLRYAEAVGRINLESNKMGAREMLAAKGGADKLLEAAKEQFGDFLGAATAVPQEEHR